MAKRKPAVSAILEPIVRRIDGCSGLFTRATGEIRDKIRRAENPPGYIDPAEAAELKDSSKLGRAIDDLQAVRASVSEIIKELQALVGERA